MPLSLSAAERRLFDEGRIPAPLLDQFGAMAFRAMGAAGRLGVFAALGDKALETGELADLLAVDERGLRVLLDALVVFGYLERRDGRFGNSAVTRQWLLDGSGGPSRLWHAAVFDLWDDLETAVRTGRPVRSFYGWLAENPVLQRDFHLMQESNANALAESVAALLPVAADARRVLDLGGGLGQYSRALCRRHPALTASVVELPETAELGVARTGEDGLADRVTFVPGDLRTIALGHRYDVVLLMNVLHTFDTDTVHELLARAARALVPGGRVVVLEHLRDRLDDVGAVHEAVIRGLDLNLLAGQEGRVLDSAELAERLEAAGFQSPAQHEVSPIDHLFVAALAGGER